MSRDSATFLDIVLAARDVIEFPAGVERGEFLRNRILQSAILHKLMVIGEAVKRLSNETRDRHPQIPWKDIAGLRDKLIHDYGQIDLGQVWDITQTRIPDLLKQIEPLISQKPGE